MRLLRLVDVITRLTYENNVDIGDCWFTLRTPEGVYNLSPDFTGKNYYNGECQPSILYTKFWEKCYHDYIHDEMFIQKYPNGFKFYYSLVGVIDGTIKERISEYSVDGRLWVTNSEDIVIGKVPDHFVSGVKFLKVDDFNVMELQVVHESLLDIDIPFTRVNSYYEKLKEEEIMNV